MKSVTRRNFATWTDFVTYATDGDTEDGRISRRASTTGWSGGSWDGAVELASKGWSDGATRIAELSAMFYNRLALHQYRKVPAFARSGPGVFNFGRLQAGHPEPYQTWVDSQTVVESVKSRGVLKVGYNVAASSMITESVIFNRGAAITTLIDCLERSGFRVEFDWGAGVRSGVWGSSEWQTVVRLKASESPVELDLLAFACAHPSALRRIMFSTMERESPAIRREFGFTKDGGYAKTAQLYGADYDVTIEGADGRDDRWTSTDTSVRWIAEQLEAQGVELVQ
jgi:hypothetical protein